MRISIVGSGYVGLVAGACLAKLGSEVTLIDTDSERVEAVNNGLSPIHEDGLNEILGQVHVRATADYRQVVDAGMIFLCVGTPIDEDGSMSLEHIIRATEQIVTAMEGGKDYHVIVVKSTVIPGTTEGVIIPILERTGRKAGRDFGVCMSPEFLREGKAVYDFMNPMRLIVGEFDKRSGDTLLDLYRNFNVPVLRTNLRTAEMIKVASNVFLTMKIAFINEIGNICKQLGIDTYEVAKGMAFDDRIGSKFLDAGIGFGGSCLPKDLRALIVKARQMGYEPGILEEILHSNEKQALKPLQLLKKHISLEGARIGLLGLAFKPETDDVRDSRAIWIVQALLQEGAVVKAYDPLAVANFKKLFPQIDYVAVEEVLNCDAILIITEWEEFKDLDYIGKIVIDGRRIPKAREARIYEGVCW